MTLRDKFIYEDTLQNRKRLGPLAWIAIFIAGLFVLACIFGAYAVLTHSVSRLQVAGSPSATAQVTLAVSSITVTPTLSSSQVVTWKVWTAKDPIGQTIYDGPTEIKQWVLRDYQTAQSWFNTHLLEKDLLLGHLGEYYTGKALTEGRTNIARAFDQSNVIMAPPIAQPRQPAPMDKPLFVSFSQDGRQMRLNDFTDTGPAKQYDTRTRKLVAITLKNKYLWQYLMEYDPVSARWKIARNTLVLNTDTDTVILSDEP